MGTARAQCASTSWVEQSATSDDSLICPGAQVKGAPCRWALPRAAAHQAARSASCGQACFS